MRWLTAYPGVEKQSTVHAWGENFIPIHSFWRNVNRPWILHHRERAKTSLQAPFGTNTAAQLNRPQ